MMKNFNTFIIFILLISLTIGFLPQSFAEEPKAEQEPLVVFLDNYGGLFNIIIFTAGIAIGIFLAGRQFKLGLKGLEMQSYHKLRTDHTNKKNHFITDQTLQKLFRLSYENELNINSLSEDEKKKIVAFYMTELNLYEQLRNEYDAGNISIAEWIQWHIWIDKVNQPQLMKETIETFRYVFEPPAIHDFEKFFVDKTPIPCKFCNEVQPNLEDLFKHFEKHHKSQAWEKPRHH